MGTVNRASIVHMTAGRKGMEQARGNAVELENAAESFVKSLVGLVSKKLALCRSVNRAVGLGNALQASVDHLFVLRFDTRTHCPIAAFQFYGLSILCRRIVAVVIW